MKKISICLTFVFVLLCVFSGSAEARRTLVLKNQAPFDLYAAFCYQDSVSKQWIIKGWWKLNARGTRTVHLNTYNGNVYIYAENRHKKYAYAGKNSSARNFLVFNHEFRTTNKTKPTGNESRIVRFNHINYKHHTKMTYTFYY